MNYIANYFSSKRHFFELLMEMTKRELTARYKNTLFGFLWVVINPLMQMFVIGFIFRFFIKEPITNYYLYLLTGLLVWNFFSLTLNKATVSIFNERNLIKKTNFPREIIPLSIILSNFVHFTLSLILLLILSVIARTIAFSNLSSLMFGSVLLLLFTIGISFLVSALNVKFRDVSFLVQATTVIWFYASPIVYSINVIPHELIWIWRMNPLTSVIQLFQNAFASAPRPGIAMLVSNIFVILFVFFVGIRIFKMESKYFDDWL